MKNKIFFLITILVSIIVGILFFSISIYQKSTIDLLSTQELDNKKTEKVNHFKDYIDIHKRLVESIKTNQDVIKYFRTNKNEAVVKNLLLSYAYLHNEIFQLRYIDKDGFEKIRIDNYTNPVVIENNKLQNKKNRYYLTDTLHKNENEIYYSNIDLNMEKGKIEKPIVPTLRIGTPIIIDNQKKGILIININISLFLKKLQSSSLHYINLIYDDGNIIVSKNSENNWSKDFSLKNKVLDIFPFLPKDYNKSNTLKTKEFFLTKLPINTKNKIFMLIIPKEFKQYKKLNNLMNNIFYILIGIVLVFLPIGYYLSLYIDKIYQKKLHYEIVETDNVLINSVLNSTNDLIFYKDKNFNYIGCNNAFTEFVNKAKNEIIGKSDFDLFEKESALLFRENDMKMLEKKQIHVNDEWVSYPNDKKRLLQTKKIPFDYDRTNNYGILGMSRDITQIHLAKEKIKEQSYIDELTKAHNRKAFNEKLTQELDLFRRYDTSFCIAMYDIDNFKKINDIYGHDIGDKVLIEMTQAVKSHIRVTDKLYRVGGEEFIIIFSSSISKNTMIALEKIRIFIENMSIIKKEIITVSIGLTQVIKNDNSEIIYKRVDKLMYNSKKSGKNKVSYKDIS